MIIETVGSALTPIELYEILKLRRVVFGDEQHIDAALDFDDLDLNETTRHMWIEDHGRITSYLRMVQRADNRWQLGRVATIKEARGNGLARELNRHALTTTANATIDIHAEEYLEDWYAAFGFTATGERVVLCGIVHVAMTIETPCGSK